MRYTSARSKRYYSHMSLPSSVCGIARICAATTFLAMLSSHTSRFAVRAFTVKAFAANNYRQRYPLPHLNVHMHREADMVEQMIGGERYEVTQLPDSMVETTLFVGNIDEFVHDDDLSGLFQSVSKLQSVPACVVRKPDMSSLQYGFVSFPSVEEKEAAIIRFNGYEWKGKKLRVQEIRDHPGRARVSVPERMVAYVSGAAKKVRGGKTNQLRRISRDDVERLSRGQPSKKKGYGSRNVPHRLNDEERAEMDRAAKKGFVSFAGTGNRRTRKGSPLANIHRQWCDARDKPQILHFKASGGRQPLDQVIVDLSPLRLNGLFDDPSRVDDFLAKWKAEIDTAASNSGMQIYTRTSDVDADENDLDEDIATDYLVTLDHHAVMEAWATKPIWKLPVVSFAVFEGDRPRAKAMAKELAALWEIPEEQKETGGGPKTRRDAGARKGGKTNMKGLSQHRKRGGGHRQSFY
jgi:hypothetical protein